LSALVGFSVGNGHTTHDAVKHVSEQYGQAKEQVKAAQKVLPAVVAAERCEHQAMEKTMGLALGVQMVDPSQLPKDCPHPEVPRTVMAPVK